MSFTGQGQGFLRPVPASAIIERSPIKSSAAVCAHCGAASIRVRTATAAFCCEGCSRVYSILRDQDMLSFYDLSDQQIASLKDRPEADYSYCDTEWFKKLFVRPAGSSGYSIRLKLPAIHCAACVWLLEKLPEMLPGVSGARINYLRKELFVTADVSLLVAKLCAFVADLGYAPDFAAATQSGAVKDGYRQRLMRKLAVAAFGFGNAMLFSLPEYFSARVEVEFNRLFLGLNILIACTVLVYSAGDFFRNAFIALRHRRVVLDVPIAVGITAMFVRSLVDVLAGTSSGYFDTFTGLIFFLLIGRYVQTKSFAWLNFERDNLLFLPLAVRVRRDDQEILVSAKDLKRGQVLRMLNAEVVPVKSRVLSEEGAIDYAFITGESLPVNIRRGDAIQPGGKIIGSAVLMEVTEEVDQARLNRIWEGNAVADAVVLPQSGFAEKILPWFTGTVIATAFAALFFWLPTDSGRAWNAFSAVLVITCPCALAMAKPFSFFTTQSVLAHGGLFLKNAAIVEKFFPIRSIVFDKTGTLTNPGAFDVEFRPATGSPESSVVATLAAIANESSHPLSRAISGLSVAQIAIVTHFQELPGKGISAVCNGTCYLLGSAAWLNENGIVVDAAVGDAASTVHASCEGKYLGHFLIRNKVREGLESTLTRLGLKYHLALISGDSEREKERFADIFHQTEDMYFNASPAKKADIIGNLRKARGGVMMIGDGLNDAAALSAADLGVAITENHSNFSPASDAILSAEALQNLDRLIAQARQARWTAVAAYAVSFAYNAFGVSIAVAGNLTPLFCAVLMPISSITVIALAFSAARTGAWLRRVN